MPSKLIRKRIGRKRRLVYRRKGAKTKIDRIPYQLYSTKIDQDRIASTNTKGTHNYGHTGDKGGQSGFRVKEAKGRKSWMRHI